MSADIYGAICGLEAEEFRQVCADAAINDNGVGIIGFGNAQTQALGSSLGSNTAEVEAVSRGARLRLSEARSELMLRKKQSMHYRPIILNVAGQPLPKPAPRPSLTI